jgi:hypothetical protein
VAQSSRVPPGYGEIDMGQGVPGVARCGEIGMGQR